MLSRSVTAMKDFSTTAAPPVDELSVGLVGAEADEPELTVAELEQRLAAGRDDFCEWLSSKELCKKAPGRLRTMLEKEPDGIALARLRAACGHDDAAVARVRPFWGLLRSDLRGLPVVFMPGAKYVTQTSTRRNTGTQYTTRALADEVVRYTLEPLAYAPGPADGAEPGEWRIRSPAELLALRVCDPAVGSGAILTAACRYLADRLIEAASEHGPGDGVFVSRLRELLDAGPDDQVTLARREIVDHCLYGVDRNPVAADMAKLSLWLTTMARERPFTFLDHAIQLGDSLLGIANVDQLRWLHLDPAQRRGEAGFETVAIEGSIDEAVDLAERLQRMSVLTVRDASAKQRLNSELGNKLANLEIVADAVVGAALSTSAQGSGTDFRSRLSGEIERIRIALGDRHTDWERQAAMEVLAGRTSSWLRTDLPDEPPMPWDRRCMHWPLRFPEVFLSEGGDGFDAIVANPPFLGGKIISTATGRSYREYLVHHVASGVRGNADLCAYFILRMCALAPFVGTLATNSISQADSREVGLDQLLESDWLLHRAVKSAPWPGTAGVEVAKLWMTGSPWFGSVILDGCPVEEISSLLEVPRRVGGVPSTLVGSSGLSFIGCSLNSMNFILDTTEALNLLADAPSEAAVIKPYLSGKDLTSNPDCRASRWVIDFGNWPEEQARRFPRCWEILEERARPAIVEKSGYRGWSDRWWQFWNPRPGLRSALGNRDKMIVIARVSKHATPALISSYQVPSDKIVVFALDDYSHLGVLSSAIHWWWAHTWCSTMRSAGLNYSPTDAFETFPLPRSRLDGGSIARVAEELHTHRSAVMVETNLGLTKIYNRVHNAGERSSDIVRLREVQVTLDHAVRDAYGWSDLDLGHYHWETPHGPRFTVCPEVKNEILDRLLELNHQRHVEEVAAGLHSGEGSGRVGRGPRNRRAPSQGSLL